MKRKILALFLVAVLGLNMMACGGNNNQANNETNTQNQQNDADNQGDQQDDQQDDTNAPEDNDQGGTSDSQETAGNTLAKIFEENAGKTPEEILNTMMNSDMIPFMGAVVPVEQGLLTGFDNAEILGFDEGCMMGPMIGSIPFVSYVFTTADEVMAVSLAALLKENANPRWNVCVEAEETVCKVVGNQVFFIMCNRSLDDSEE